MFLISLTIESREMHYFEGLTWRLGQIPTGEQENNQEYVGVEHVDHNAG